MTVHKQTKVQRSYKDALMDATVRRKQIPTLASNENDDGYINMDNYLYWYNIRFRWFKKQSHRFMSKVDNAILMWRFC